MRSEAELREQKEHFRKQALEYRHAKNWAEAWLCASIVGVLSYALGETSSPTVRVKLERGAS